MGPVPTATWPFGAVAYKWLEGYFSGTVFAAAGAFDAGTYITWPNYQPSETGVNNAIACVLVDTAGNAITQSAGLRLVIKLAHTLQAGANTLALNGGTAKSIKSHRNPANNISTAYAVGGIVDLMYDGTQYQDMSQ